MKQCISKQVVSPYIILTQPTVSDTLSKIYDILCFFPLSDTVFKMASQGRGRPCDSEKQERDRERESCSTNSTFGGKSGRRQAGVIERKAKVEGQLCQSVGPLVCWSVGLLVHTCIEIMTVFCFSAPAHPSATGGRVYSLHLNFIKLDPGLKAYNLIVIQLIEIKFMR